MLLKSVARPVETDKKPLLRFPVVIVKPWSNLMSLKCLLGFAVCLSYNGSWISNNEVNEIKRLCRQVADAPVTSFLNRTGDNRSGNSSGAEIADKLDGLGLEFSWSREGSTYAHQLAALNKKAVSNACKELRAVARGQKNWSE